MRNRRINAAAAVVGVMAVLAVCGAAYGAWKITGKAVNVLTTPTFSNRIEEEYQVPSHVNPGQKVDKIVNVKNDGTTDSYVRVMVTKAFGTRNENGEFVKEDGLDPELIQVEYSSSGWTLRDDGYWYYTDVLKAGETTGEPLLKGYQLSEKADNRYKNKEGEILVTMESIQAGEKAMENLWGVKEEELGITPYVSGQAESATQVVLEANHQLSVKADKTDLFVNFKNLLPGCSRTQTVQITNKDSKSAALFLRAEAADQEYTSAADLEKVQTLLQKYARIKVMQGEKLLYEGPADGNLTGKGLSMAKDISLGSFDAGKSEKLTVTLSVDPAMDNSYQSLIGKVNWIFTASGEDGSGQESGNGGSGGNGSESGSGSASGWGNSAGKVGPKTGDDTPIMPLIFLLGISVLAAATVLLGEISGRMESRGRRLR